MYPVDSIRIRRRGSQMGHTPTIMDYSRFNYVAQPEDEIPVADLIPKIGPYDKFAVSGATSRYERTPPKTSGRHSTDGRGQQDAIPWFRFSASDAGGKGGADAGEQTEALATPIRCARRAGLQEHPANHADADSGDNQTD